MSLDRTKYSFLERKRADVAEAEKLLADMPPPCGNTDVDAAADSIARQLHSVSEDYYKARQDRMDETARAVLANLWAMNRPSIKNAEDVANANLMLHALANESWQIALALEQTRIGYDCAAMQGKRKQDAEKVVNNVD